MQCKLRTTGAIRHIRHILGGNQVNLPISIPINICGIAIGVLGNAFANCEGGAAVVTPAGDVGVQIRF